jgi:glutaminase
MHTHEFTSPVSDFLRELHEECARLHGGRLADYIPELTKANPGWFGICLVSTDGHVYEVGDSGVQFTIQSVSKPFVYGLALEDNTRQHVLTRAGVEPTGDAFNSISLDPGTGRPRNPMINAGAIATTGMIAGKSLETRWERILEMFGRYAGRPLGLDEDVYRSEAETGHRNRAIGHMLRNFNILTEPPDPIVDLYFRQCSISVTARDLGIMAATLANAGVNPVTGQRALRGEYVESVLGVMGTCGMYDFAGEWLYKVGIPAKSGVAGGILAVLPGQIGIGVYSPLIDDHGNSVRGIRVCEELSRAFNLHLFNAPEAVGSAIRNQFSAAEFNSKRVRAPHEIGLLREHGRGLRLYELQGNLSFARAERVIRDIVSKAEAIDLLILDLKHVVALPETSCRLMAELVLRFAARDRPVAFTHAGTQSALRRIMKAKLGARFEELFIRFPENDTALEWGEEILLARHGPPPGDLAVAPADYEIFAGLSADEITAVASLLERRHYPAGARVIEIGAEASEFYIVVRGRISARIPLPDGSCRRLATFSGGMVFGELAAIDGAPRSAEIVADSDIECDVFSVASFRKLGETHPRVKIVLLQNFTLLLCRRLRKANRELAVLDD